MLLTMALALTVGVLAAGCGWAGGAPGSTQLKLGYINWDENVAVSTPTKEVLEEELGYEAELDVTTEDVVKQVLRHVAGGDLNGFQVVWIANHKNYLSEDSGDVEHLAPW